MSSNSFKNKLMYKLFAYEANMYKQDLVLNNPQEIIYYKTPTNHSPYASCITKVKEPNLPYHLCIARRRIV